jgi:hypothetical protein
MSSNYYRYENKFYISNLTKYEIESIIHFHPAFFSKLYQNRYVNNIYFDYYNFNSFHDNLDGSMHRIKFRIRWYGDLFGNINEPTLELKFKNGLLGYKNSYPLLPFNIDPNDNSFNKQTLIKSVINTDIPDTLKTEIMFLRPLLLNRYFRSYFQSSCKDFRITVDSGLTSYRLNSNNNSFLHKLFDNINVILELKYDSKANNRASEITNYFPFRLTKSSKYVSGIELIYG